MNIARSRRTIILLALSLLLTTIMLGEVKASPENYVVEIQAIDIDGTSITGLNVTVYNETSQKIGSLLTNNTGWAVFTLEPGNYTFKAFWHDLEVGLTTGEVTGNATYVLQCQLARIQIQAVNLKGEPLSSVDVEVYNGTDFTAALEAERTDSSGWVRDVMLSNGSYYSFKVFDMGVEVSSLLNQYIVTSESITMEAQIGYMSVTVEDDDGNPLPNIEVEIILNTTDRTGQLVNISSPVLTTDSTGMVIRPNLWINVSCQIEAKRQGILFYNSSIENLTPLEVDGWVNITITCQKYLLTVQVIDSIDRPISNVHVNLYDWSDGSLKESKTTDATGNAAFSQLAGKYTIKVYNYSSILQRTIPFNETTIDLVSNETLLIIRCQLFNLTLTIKVVDYLGQPIPNAKIKIEYEDVIVSILRTDSNGMASQDGVISGDYRISVYIDDKLCEVTPVSVEVSQTVVMRVSGYITIGGHLFDLTQFIALVSISLLVAIFLILMTYKRIGRSFRKAAPKK